MAEIFIGDIRGVFQNGNLQVTVEWSFTDTTPPFSGELQIVTQGQLIKIPISGSGTSGASQAIANFVNVPLFTVVRVRGLIGVSVVAEQTVTLQDTTTPPQEEPLTLSVSGILYENGIVNSTLNTVAEGRSFGRNLKYVVTATNRLTGVAQAVIEESFIVNDNNIRTIRLSIPDSASNPNLTVAWGLFELDNTIIDIIQQDVDAVLPQMLNKSFNVLFRDDTRTQQFILDPVDFDMIIDAQDVNFWFVENVLDDSRPVNATVAQILQIINDRIGMLPNDSVDDSMVSQSIGVFEIKDDRLTGEILYIANSSFNPFWYGKPILSIIQIKDDAGFVNVVKFNNIMFTETQRDERIIIDEIANGAKKITVDFFIRVSDTDARAFSKNLLITVEEGAPPPPQPTPVGESSLFGKVVGAFFGLTALTLLTSRGR